MLGRFSRSALRRLSSNAEKGIPQQLSVPSEFWQAQDVAKLFPPLGVFKSKEDVTAARNYFASNPLRSWHVQFENFETSQFTSAPGQTVLIYRFNNSANHSSIIDFLRVALPDLELGPKTMRVRKQQMQKEEAMDDFFFLVELIAGSQSEAFAIARRLDGAVFDAREVSAIVI